MLNIGIAIVYHYYSPHVGLFPDQVPSEVHVLVAFPFSMKPSSQPYVATEPKVALPTETPPLSGLTMTPVVGQVITADGE